MSTTAEAKKAPPVTYTLTITAEGKEGLTFDDVMKMRDQGNKMKDALKPFGTVEGEVTFGKQTLKL
jgi:hypothetical protein